MEVHIISGGSYFACVAGSQAWVVFRLDRFSEAGTVFAGRHAGVTFEDGVKELCIVVTDGEHDRVDGHV